MHEKQIEKPDTVYSIDTRALRYFMNTQVEAAVSLFDQSVTACPVKPASKVPEPLESIITRVWFCGTWFQTQV